MTTKVLFAGSRFGARGRSFEDSSEESFEHLFRSYSGRLWGFFKKRGLTPEECNDLTQETFLQVYRSLPSFEGRSSFETWLFHLAANVYYKWLRRRRARKRQGHEVTWDRFDVPEPRMDDEVDPGRKLLGKEQVRLVRQAVAELPGQMRRCLQLRVYQELSYAEVAAVMKISVQTVKVQLFRARQRLVEKLRGELE